ncbi:hypothetical protein V2G26_011707 [Clonostachys chloroleuca]
MRAGRFVCVGIPVLLTIGAIVSYLIAALSGVAHNSVYLFKVDLSKLDIDENSISNFVSENLGILGRDAEEIRGITASNLGFGDSYDVNLWGYCMNKNGTDRECTKAQFDWASTRIKKDFLDPIAGKSVELPSEMKSALNVFTTVTKYTEIAFIIALVSLGVELLVGIFSNCTRIISCLTTLIGIVAILFSLAASGLATGMAVVVVSAIKTIGKPYGVEGSFNGNFLACIWIGFAFSLAAGLFWLFTICCCKPDHREKRRSDGEKLIPSSGYYPIGSDNEMTSGQGYHNQYQPSYNKNSRTHGHSNSDVAYEPFSHRA